MSLAQFAHSWKTAWEPTVIRRAVIMAAIVGSILVTINHGTCIWQGCFGRTCLIQSLLTFFVPYAVSTVSSVQAIHCRARRASGGSA